MNEPDFLRLVLEQPEDDLTRLAYADWLMERGDAAGAARGEFIQAQIQLARRAEGTGSPSEWIDAGRVPRLQAREKELLAAHEAEWARPVVPLVSDYTFRKGFIEHVTMTDAQFPRNAAKLFAAAPVRRLRPTGGISPRLMNSPHWGRLSGLDFGRSLLGDVGLGVLLDCAHLHNLVWLDLSECALTGRAIARLAESPLLGRLRHLNLAKNHLPLASLQTLLQSPHWGSLTSLVLNGNRIDGRAEQFLTQMLRGSASPSLLRSVLQLSSRGEREYTNAAVRDLESRAGRQPAELVRTLAGGLGDGRRKVRAAAARLLADIGPDGTEALPGMVCRLFDRTPLVRDQVAPALARMVSALPGPMQRWMCVLANPLLTPGHNLWTALERDELPRAVLDGFASVLARRAAWYAHTLAGKHGPVPPGPSAPDGLPAVLTATTRLLATAGRHAARHGGGESANEAGRHREAAWLLGRLTGLLLAAHARR